MSLENGKLNRRDFLTLTGNAVLAGLVDTTNAVSRKNESAELIPTEESVEETFIKVLEGQKAKERRKATDEYGVYLWEIEFEVDGGTIELNYMRKGKHATGGFSPDTKIHVIYFDEEGIPEGGTNIATFEDGKWKMT